MNYLYRRNGYYYFRLKVPNDLQAYFSSNEIKKALRTKELKHAKILVKTLSFKTEKLFTLIRGNMLTDDQIKKLVAEYLRKTLSETEEGRALGIGIPRDEEELSERLETFSMLESDYREDLAFNKLNRVEAAVNDILEEHFLKIEKDSLEYKKLCRELLKASVAFLSVENKRLVGDYENEAPFTGSGLGYPSATLQANNGKPVKLFSELIDEYIEDKKLRGKWSLRTLDEFTGIFKLLRDLMQAVTGKEDIEVQAIDRQTMQRFSSALASLPANITKAKEYRGKPLEIVLKMVAESSANPMAIRTLNKKIENLSSLFDFAATMGYVNINVAKGLSVSERSKAIEKKSPYTADDLKRLFASPWYTSPDKEKPEVFWIPLVALYTGARREEVCQLNVTDVIEDAGIPCFNITDTEEDQKVKTKAAVRKVPIHPHLIKLGFLKYVASLKAKGKVKLWGNLKADKYGYYGKNYGTMFGKHLRKYVTEDKKKDFHSFRRTFIDTLKQKGVEVHLMQEIVGHDGDKPLVLGTYSNAYNVPMRLEALKQIDFGIDLSHLKFPL